MSVPNMITLLRIVLTPIFVCLYLEGEHAAAMSVLAVAAASDMLDGAIARRFNLITPLGKVLDPMADKILQLAMLLCLVSMSRGVIPVIMLHILRETLLGFMGIITYKRCGRLIGSRWYGKVCTGFMYVFLAGALLWPGMPQHIMNAGMFVCALFIVYCLLSYALEYMRILRADGAIENPHSV